jgi:hypothetical protein
MRSPPRAGSFISARIRLFFIGNFHRFCFSTRVQVARTSSRATCRPISAAPRVIDRHGEANARDTAGIATRFLDLRYGRRLGLERHQALAAIREWSYQLTGTVPPREAIWVSADDRIDKKMTSPTQYRALSIYP